MRPYAVFYHLGQLGDWEEIYLEQMERLLPVLAEADALYIHVNGNEELSMVPDGAVVVRNSDQLLEADTLVAVRQHAERNPGHDILYLHSKGVTRFEREEGVWDNVVAWRKYLEKCVIDESDFCRTKLAEGYSACGPMLQRCSYLLEASTQKIFPSYTPHFCGNFWWASAQHILSLPMEILYEEWRDSGHARFQSERWIGAGPSELNKAYDMGGPRTLNSYYATAEQWEGDMNWNPRICVLVMFANESKVLRRMLDSTLGYGHYYVFQDNGSTDGSDQIARDFLAENNIEGHLYYPEEGWVNFGWNRNHVLQTAKELDHNCDWFMKMDCDEMLRIDETFDWQWLRDLSMPAWNLLAYAGDSVYDRTWMWQTGYDWAFNPDPAHETIRCDDMIDGEKENFPSVRLPGFGHTCTTEGSSYDNPFKYINDSLRLEEKGINEGMYDDIYHYWYIGHSYYDASKSQDFPLGESQRKEFARRGVWYYERWMSDYKELGWAPIELAYNACIMLGDMYVFTLTEYDKGIEWYRKAASYCPGRNEHAASMGHAALAFDNKAVAAEALKVLGDESRAFPIDWYQVFLSRSAYLDQGGGQHAHIKSIYETTQGLGISVEQKRRMIIIDNVYEDPYAVREYALSLPYDEDDRWYKGKRSRVNHQPGGLPQLIERAIGQPIQRWDTQGINGCFQITTSKDQQVYHYDDQRWAGVLYLTPDAPAQSGTRLLRSKVNGTRNSREDDREVVDKAFNNDFYDSTKFEVVDSAGNIFNRLILMDANSYHSAGPYFGNTPEEGRLVQLFFFD